MSSSPSNTTCGACQKSFSRPENLARHMRGVHTNEAQYQCTQCQKRFTRSDLLRKHRKVHARATSTSVPPSGWNPEQHHVEDSSVPSASASDDHVHTLPSVDGYLNNIARQPATVNVPQSVQILDDSSSRSGIRPLEANDNTGWFSNGPSYGEGVFDVDLAWTFDYVVDHPHQSLYNTSLPEVPLSSGNQTVRDGRTVNSVSTNDSQTDWPDGESRSVSPSRGPESQHSWLSRFVDPNEMDQIMHEYRHVPVKCRTVSLSSARRILNLLSSAHLNEFCDPLPVSNDFPSTRILDHFLLLYFVHVHSRFPVIHMATFSPDTCSPELLLSMILAGSCHSVTNRHAFCNAYIQRARMSVTLQRERNGNQTKDTEYILALLLLSLTATWSGQTEAYRRAESDRGVLMSACRRCRLLDCRSSKLQNNIPTTMRGQERLNSAWLHWAEMEMRKRLGLSIYIFDCQFAALLQRQPYISKAETTNTSLPCDSVYWEAPTAQAWKLLLGPAEMPPSTYHLPTLTSILLGKELDDTMYFPPLDSFSRVFYVYVIHTHIFEWRQAVCMLNSTGLKDTPVSFAPEHMGEGVLDRQRWLFGALETWSEAYGSTVGNDRNSIKGGMGGQLLYHLGYLGLCINFADLYVVAGRSGSQDDIFVATESIRNRLIIDKSYKILDHAFQMLSVAFEVVETNSAQQCSFEVAVCLFMGGLVCWAVCHVPQQPDLTGYLIWLQQNQFLGNNSFSQSPSTIRDGRTLLMQKTQAVIAALRSLPFLGFASIFASVLEKLCHDWY